MKWAQRSDKVYLTVILPDAKDPNVKIEPDGKFVFTASGYELDFDLFEGVNVEVNAAFFLSPHLRLFSKRPMLLHVLMLRYCS